MAAFSGEIIGGEKINCKNAATRLPAMLNLIFSITVKFEMGKNIHLPESSQMAK